MLKSNIKNKPKEETKKIENKYSNGIKPPAKFDGNPIIGN